MKLNLSSYVGPLVWLLAASMAYGCGASSLPPQIATPTPTVLKRISPTATATIMPPTATPTPIPPPTATPTPTTGTVSGSVCYPSTQNPPLTLYLQNRASGDTAQLDIPPNRPRYTRQLPPGEYIAYALTVGTEQAGVYSGCTSSADCASRQPLPFRVRNGQTTKNINLCNWYNAPGLIPAASGVVTVTTVQKMNVFAGPGLDFPTLGFALSRASAPAFARTLDGTWLQIIYPAVQGSAWIYARLAQVSGQPDNLPFVLPKIDLAGDPLSKLEKSSRQFSPAAWNASRNKAIVHFKGSIKDEKGRPVNGFSVLADNGTWSVLSHPTGPSHWYPDLRDGQWDIIITNPSDAAGWWTLTVASYDCPGFEAGFNAQCKQFTRLSENQLVQIVYPDETVIQADWVCHFDCDKGLYVKAYHRPKN